MITVMKKILSMTRADVRISLSFSMTTPDTFMALSKMNKCMDYD